MEVIETVLAGEGEQRLTFIPELYCEDHYMSNVTRWNKTMDAAYLYTDSFRLYYYREALTG